MAYKVFESAVKKEAFVDTKNMENGMKIGGGELVKKAAPTMR